MGTPTRGVAPIGAESAEVPPVTTSVTEGASEGTLAEDPRGAPDAPQESGVPQPTPDSDMTPGAAGPSPPVAPESTQFHNAIIGKTTLLAPEGKQRGQRLRALKSKQARDRIKKAKLPPGANDFTSRLDPTTFEPWLLIVRARAAGLTTTEIARATEIDEELVVRIVTSPMFLGFESSYRKVVQLSPALELAAQKAMELVPKSIEMLAHWMEQDHPDMAGASLSAIKQLHTIVGLQTEAKRTIEKHVIKKVIIKEHTVTGWKEGLNEPT